MTQHQLVRSEDDTEVGDSLHIAVENMGGINHCNVKIEPGVTILSGRNATNRTSFLRSIASVFGGNSATLKSDADNGWVELKTDGKQYRREYERQGNSVKVQGDAFSSEEDLVDSFACLLASNPARQAVEQGNDLRNVIMEPVDMGGIRRDIRELNRKVEQIENQIAGIEEKKEELPSLESKKEDLLEEQSEIEDRIEETEDRIEEYDADETEARKAEKLLDELDDVKSRRRQLGSKIERQEEQLEQLKEEKEEVEQELADITTPDDSLAEIENEIEQLERRERELKDEISDILQVVQFNDDLLTDDGPDIADLENGNDVTAVLDPTSEEVECWTCGSTVELEEIEERLNGLRDIASTKRSERDEVSDRLSELKSNRAELQSEIDEKSNLERRLEEIGREVDHRKENINDFEEERASLEGEIEEIKARVDETEELRDSDLVEAYQNLSDLEYERGQIEQQLGDIEKDIEEIESDINRLAGLRDRLEDKKEDRKSLRNKINDLERETVENFNEHMDELLSILGYGNIARVWIERVGTGGSNGQAADRFELHVVRETEEGAGYEDLVENLSESERELIGLVVGLVGYQVHRVYETVPVMLLDSLEAIDSDRIAQLVEYFADSAPYLLVALLPEDEQALPDEYDRVPESMLS